MSGGDRRRWRASLWWGLAVWGTGVLAHPLPWEENPLYRVGERARFRSQWEGAMRTGVAELGRFEVPLSSRGEHRLQVKAEGASVRWIFSQRMEEMELNVPTDLSSQVRTPPSYERPEAAILVGSDGGVREIAFAAPVDHPTRYAAVAAGTNLDLPLLLAYHLSRPPPDVRPGLIWEAKSARDDLLVYTLKAEALAPASEPAEPGAGTASPTLRWRVQFEFTTRHLLPPTPDTSQFGRMETSGLYTGDLVFSADPDTLGLQRAEGAMGSQLQIIARGMVVDVEVQARGWLAAAPGEDARK